MTGRLIDANKLKTIVEVSTRFSDFLGRRLNDEKTAEVFRSATDGFIRQIDAEPTVEAIPIEFIKQCQSNHLIFITELLDAWAERKDE